MFVSLPRSFLPEEDQGYFIVVAQLPDGASKRRTDAVLERIEKVFQANPAVSRPMPCPGRILSSAREIQTLQRCLFRCIYGTNAPNRNITSNR